MLDVRGVTKIFGQHTPNEKVALDGLSLKLDEGDFVTIIGSNGAGKSTLLNLVAGEFRPESGSIWIDSIDVTKLPDFKVARYVGRVFQDPLAGTAPHGTIEQNLAMAYARGHARGLRLGVTNAKRALFRTELERLELGLEHRLRTDATVGLDQERHGVVHALQLLARELRIPRVLRAASE